ncbi:MAG: preprotein translocase subunit SecG [Planctomycetota bacterium]
MDWVKWLLTGLFVVIAVLMTFLILLQEGKGGGLAALGGTKAAGVEGVTNPIRRATAWLAGIFFFIAILLGVLSKPEPSADFFESNAESPPKTEAQTGTEASAPKPAAPIAPVQIPVKTPEASTPKPAAPIAPVQIPAKTPEATKPTDKSAEKPAD